MEERIQFTNETEWEELDIVLPEFNNCGAQNICTVAPVCSRLQQFNEGRRVVAHFLDIRINLEYLYADLASYCAKHNRNKGVFNRSVGKEPSREIVLEKLRMQKNLSDFILRYRATWDKFMRLFIFVFKPEQVDVFDGARRKLGAFKKIFKNHEHLSTVSQEIYDRLDEFNNKFRGKEAHDYGNHNHFLTKSNVPKKDGGELALLGYWNWLLQCINAFIDFIKNLPIEVCS